MSAAVAPVLGHTGKLYYNSGSYGSPTWVLIDNAGEIEVGLSAEKANIKLRKNGGFKADVPGEIEYTYALKMMYDLADTKQAALRTAFFARSSMDILDMDQAVATVGAYGFRSTMGVFKFQPTRPDSGPMMVEVELAPTYSANPPSEFTVAS